jgi:hypothetical protein
MGPTSMSKFLTMAVVAAALVDCGPSMSVKDLDLAEDVASLQVSYGEPTVHLDVVPSAADCRTLGSRTIATFNGVSMTVVGLGGESGEKCLPISFSLVLPSNESYRPPGPAVDGTVILTDLDSTHSWVMTAKNLIAPRAIAWVSPSNGVVRSGDALVLGYSPASDQSPASGELQMVPASPGDARVWQEILTSHGGFEILDSEVHGTSRLQLEDGFRWDAVTGTIAFALPTSPQFPTGAATITYNGGSLSVPIEGCAGPSACSASVLCGSFMSLPMIVVP